MDFVFKNGNKDQRGKEGKAKRKRKEKNDFNLFQFSGIQSTVTASPFCFTFLSRCKAFL